MHGVNLDMLGRRDPLHYGTLTLAELERADRRVGARAGPQVSCFQTNLEGEFVEHLHSLLRSDADGILLNPGAWTHYAWAIHDALEIDRRCRRSRCTSPMSRSASRGGGLSVIGDLCLATYLRARDPRATRAWQLERLRERSWTGDASVSARAERLRGRICASGRSTCCS